MTDTPQRREHEHARGHEAPECTTQGSGASSTRLQRAAMCNRCGVAYPSLDLYYDHRCVERRSGVVGQQADALRDLAVRQLEASIQSTAKVDGIAGSVLYLLFAIAAIVAAVVLGGCSSTLQTSVRRVDSMAEIDRVSEDMGADGWRIVSVVTPDRGWSWVIVYQREAGASWE